MSESSFHEHHNSSHHHRHHQKRRIKIPKNILIITLAAFALVGLFVLLVRYYDQQDEELLQYIPEISTTAVPKSINPKNTSTSVKGSDPQETIRWCALGDSITYGCYSLTDQAGKTASSVTGRENIGWAYQVTEKNHWSLTNLAFSNEGYLNPANNESRTPGYVQARMTDFTPYNLVTISLGINDWISNCPIGSMEDDPSAETITAFIPAMRATIEAVAKSNPVCKILVLLPMNVKGYNQVFGTQDTNWTMGYAMSSSGTLKQFTDTMKEICEYYGVEYIDLAFGSCINSVNLPALLPDGVHPSAEAHKLLANELAAKILFK